MSFTIAEPHICSEVDKPALEAWQRDGILKMEGLVPAEWIEYGRHRVRETLGADPEHPDAWTNLKPSVLKPLGQDPKCIFIDANPITNAVDELIGPGWYRPKSGGTWFGNTPTHTDADAIPASDCVPRGNWHWDNRPDLFDSGLWMFTPLADLPPRYGGTWLVAGSYRIVCDFYDQLPPEKRGRPTKQVKKWFTRAHPWFKALNSAAPLDLTVGENGSMRLLTVSGVPGDVVFMKDFTVHSIPAVIGPGPRVCHMITASKAT